MTAPHCPECPQRAHHPRPHRPTIQYQVTRLAGIPMDPPVSFSAPADATDAELERAAVAAMLRRTA